MTPLTSEELTLVAQYRELRKAVEKLVRSRFPVNSRVWPTDCKRAHWLATVGHVNGDQVWCEWDNGNRYEVPFGEIELALAPPPAEAV